MDETLTAWCRRAKNEYTRILDEQRLKRTDSIRHEFADNRQEYTAILTWGCFYHLVD